MSHRTELGWKATTQMHYIPALICNRQTQGTSSLCEGDGVGGQDCSPSKPRFTVLCEKDVVL